MAKHISGVYDPDDDPSQRKPDHTPEDTINRVLEEKRGKRARRQKRHGTKTDEQKPTHEKKGPYDAPKPDPEKYQDDLDKRYP